MENLKRKRTFAASNGEGDLGPDGITYRQWVVGMALAGFRDHCLSPELRAIEAVASADTAIALVGEEMPSTPSRITMRTEFDLEQALDDIEQARRMEEESMRDLFANAKAIYEELDKAIAIARQRVEELFLLLLDQEIDSDNQKCLGFKGLHTRGANLFLVEGNFCHRNVSIKVSLDWRRLGDFWLINLDSEPVRRCDKGELMETLLQTFAQIRFNEKSAIAEQTVE